MEGLRVPPCPFCENSVTFKTFWNRESAKPCVLCVWLCTWCVCVVCVCCVFASLAQVSERPRGGPWLQSSSRSHVLVFRVRSSHLRAPGRAGAAGRGGEGGSLGTAGCALGALCHQHQSLSGRSRKAAATGLSPRSPSPATSRASTSPKELKLAFWQLRNWCQSNKRTALEIWQDFARVKVGTQEP